MARVRTRQFFCPGNAIFISITAFPNQGSGSKAFGASAVGFEQIFYGRSLVDCLTLAIKPLGDTST
jgi:hypothetical protein